MNRNVVIRIVCLADGRPTVLAGHWIKGFDPGPPGSRGMLRTATDVRDARVFPEAVDAFKFWKQENGTRLDGKPNRPLTAFTVTVHDLETGDVLSDIVKP